MKLSHESVRSFWVCVLFVLISRDLSMFDVWFKLRTMSYIFPLLVPPSTQKHDYIAQRHQTLYQMRYNDFSALTLPTFWTYVKRQTKSHVHSTFGRSLQFSLQSNQSEFGLPADSNESCYSEKSEWMECV